MITTGAGDRSHNKNKMESEKRIQQKVECARSRWANRTQQERDQLNERRRKLYAESEERQKKARERSRRRATENREAYNASARRSDANRKKRQSESNMAIGILNVRPKEAMTIKSLTEGFAALDELAEMWFD